MAAAVAQSAHLRPHEAAHSPLRGQEGKCHVAVSLRGPRCTLGAPPALARAADRATSAHAQACARQAGAVPLPSFSPRAQRGAAGPSGFGAPVSKGKAAAYRKSRVRAAASLKEEAAALVDDLRGTSIFLVGMMGSGKSTVGRVLAEALGYYFFDSDEVVEQAAGGVSVKQIFDENGEEAFRGLETHALSELSSLGRLVVSTGGGAILRPTNWSYLQHGITVFIDVPVPLLASRVLAMGTASRPLLAANGSAEQGEQGAQGGAPSGAAQQETKLQETTARLQGIFDERCKLYRNADTTVSLQDISGAKGVSFENITPEDIATEVVLSIGKMVLERKQKDAAIRSRSQDGA